MGNPNTESNNLQPLGGFGKQVAPNDQKAKTFSKLPSGTGGDLNNQKKKLVNHLGDGGKAPNDQKQKVFNKLPSNTGGGDVNNQKSKLAETLGKGGGTDLNGQKQKGTGNKF